MSSLGLRSHHQWVAPAVQITFLAHSPSLCCKHLLQSHTSLLLAGESFLLPCPWGSHSLQPTSEGIS